MNYALLTDMTFESKVKVIMLKICLWLVTRTPLSCFEPRVFIFGIMIVCGVWIAIQVTVYEYDLGFKGQCQIYLKSLQQFVT